MHKNCLNKIRKYDEYYTKYEHVKDMFDRYIPHEELKDKIIYCPCDSEKSNFVIYLKEYKEDLGYKELIYTWDDYKTHIDLFEYCDIIITNPPFSKLVKEFIPILNKVNKKFFILGSSINILSYVKYFNNIDNIKFISDNKRNHDEDYRFILPNGTDLPARVGYIYITNLNSKTYRNKIQSKKNQVSLIYGIDTENNKYKNYDFIRHIPENEYDKILVPVTVYMEETRKYFDIYGSINIKQYTDNKNRYIRILVKRKVNILE